MILAMMKFCFMLWLAGIVLSACGACVGCLA